MASYVPPLPEVEARTHHILINIYPTAHTTGDVLAAVLLMHCALEQALSHHVGALNPEADDFLSKVDALPVYDWPQEVRNELGELNDRRSNLAHPTHVNHRYVLETADDFVEFLQTNWAQLFSPWTSPPNVVRPTVSSGEATEYTKDVAARLRSILTIEYAGAVTQGDMLAALLLLHKSTEEYMESRIPRPPAGVKCDFRTKAAQVFSERQQELVDIHKQRSQYAHPVAYDEGQIARTGYGLARFVADNWNVMGDGQRLEVTHPLLALRYATPTSTPQQVPVAPAHQIAAVPPPPPRHRFEWNLFLSTLLYGGLALWFTGITRALWAFPPLNGVRPAYFSLALAIICALLMLWRATSFVRKSGLLRASLAVLGLLGLIIFVGIVRGWPPVGILSGEWAGRNMAHYIEQVSGVNAPAAPAAPASAPVIIQPTAQPQEVVATPAAPVEEVGTPGFQPSAIERTEIGVGAQVRVTTAGNNLNGRSQPGIASELVVSFPNGATLEVLDGPRTADGYTWWLVSGEAGEGWSAGDFLTLVE
ncbi:MAG: SH3 domain-containing protein [Chloroflexota bacterium]